jgi:hypothetical protein
MNHRWFARAIVVAAHLALLAALWLHRPPRLEAPGERRVTTVRLVQPRIREAPPPVPPRMPRPAAPQAPAATRPATEAAPEAPATPAATAPAPEAAVTAEPPRSTLRLTLPPGYAASSAAARNPALGDARSNTPRRTLEERIADAAGVTGPVEVERTSDHRMVMRRGDTCQEVFRSRIADMDPFNGNVAPRTIGMFGKPYKCK